VPKSYSLCKFAPQFDKPFQKIIDVRMRAGLSMAAINRDIHCLNKLSNYLDGLNIQLLEELESVHVMGFVKSLSVAGKLPTLDGVASSLRILLKFLSGEHYVSKDLSQCVPKIKSKFDGIPSAYTKDEVQQLIEGVDRTGPKGKRDYAMILLAARLGMRASDICGLTFDNLKWQTNTIEFNVKKTGTKAVLPLLNEVGEAIIEHIKYGRPTSEDKHVFLRMEIPHVEITPASLHGIVSKGLRNANIPLLPGKRHGPHALRASLASAMLDKHTPLPVISEALTHANSDTTRIYLKIDLQHLREYSLEVPPLGNVWLGGVAR
jgi:site-specific recombinase XerD